MKKPLIFILIFVAVIVSAQSQTKEIWGIARDGGLNGYGTIFQYDPITSVVTKKYDFIDSLGGTPANLIQAGDGMLYGMTMYGGLYQQGALFQFDPTTLKYSKKYDIPDSLGGGLFSSLVKANDGMLYGTTGYNATSTGPTMLFQYNPFTSVLTKKATLVKDSQIVISCYLMLASDGTIYGTAQNGFIFQYDPVTDHYSEKYTGTDEIDGRMVQAKSGMMYGMASGGKKYFGVIYQFNPFNSTYKAIYDFDKDPFIGISHLTLYNDTLLYGMTGTGGANNYGELFEFNLVKSSYTVKADLAAIPALHGHLLNASDGILYGAGVGDTSNYQNGLLFRYDPRTAFYKIEQGFDGTNGAFPYASLIEIDKTAATIGDMDELQKITCYPNPTSGIIKIDLESQNDKNNKIRLINILGEVLLEFTKITDNNFTMDISGYPNGIYFLEINGRMTAIKIIKL